MRPSSRGPCNNGRGNRRTCIIVSLRRRTARSGKCFHPAGGPTSGLVANYGVKTVQMPGYGELNQNVFGTYWTGKSLSKSGGDAVLIRYPRGGFQDAASFYMTSASRRGRAAAATRAQAGAPLAARAAAQAGSSTVPVARSALLISWCGALRRLVVLAPTSRSRAASQPRLAGLPPGGAGRVVPPPQRPARRALRRCAG